MVSEKLGRSSCACVGGGEVGEVNPSLRQFASRTQNLVRTASGGNLVDDEPLQIHA